IPPPWQSETLRTTGADAKSRKKREKTSPNILFSIDYAVKRGFSYCRRPRARPRSYFFEDEGRGRERRPIARGGRALYARRKISLPEGRRFGLRRWHRSGR